MQFIIGKNLGLINHSYAVSNRSLLANLNFGYEKIGNDMKKYIIQISLFLLLAIICTDAVVSTSGRMKIHAYEVALFQRMDNMATEQKV